MARVPEQWAKMAMQHVATTDDEILLAAITDLLFYLEMEGTSPRLSWNEGYDWYTNVGLCHEEQSFHAILSNNRHRFHPRCHDAILSMEEVLAMKAEGSAGKWACEFGDYVRRTSAAMVTRVEGIMQMGHEIVFVDPYFSPRSGYYDRPMAAFFNQIVKRDRQQPRRIDIVCSRRRCSPSWTDDECRGWLARVASPYLPVRVFTVDDDDESQRLHDRYILSELGGVQFGHSLTESNRVDNRVTISGLARGAYEQIWSIYGNMRYSFPKAQIIG